MKRNKYKYYEIDGQLEMDIEVKETKYNYWEVFFKADEEETKEDTQLEMNKVENLINKF